VAASVYILVAKLVSLEPWHCANCGATLPLDVRGKCAHCGSEAVIAEAVLPTEDTLVQAATVEYYAALRAETSQSSAHRTPAGTKESL
jgi:predicted ATP-dependent serine protease